MVRYNFFSIIKHLTKFEFNSSKSSFYKSCLTSLLCSILLPIWPDETKFLLYLLGIGFPLALFIGKDSLLGGLSSPANQQSSSFSWKYIHTTIADRKGFIIAFSLSNSFYLLPLIVFLIAVYIDLEADIKEYAFWFLPLIPGVFFLKLASLRLVLISPRKRFFKYNDTFSYFLKRLLTTLFDLTVFTCGVIASFQVVMYFQAFSNAKGAIVFSSIVVFCCIVMYFDIKKAWLVEDFIGRRLVREIFLLLFCIAIAFVFFFLNTAVHGLMGGRHIAFDYVEDQNIQGLINLSKKNDLSRFHNWEGSNLLQHSIVKDRVLVIKKLMSMGFDLKKKVSGRTNEHYDYRKGRSPLFLAIENDSHHALKFLLDQSLPTKVNEDGIPALSFAALNCSPFSLKVLHENGANLDEISKHSATALFYAVKGECMPAVIYLLNNGADSSWKSDKKQTYLDFAKDKHPRFYNSLKFYLEDISNDVEGDGISI